MAETKEKTPLTQDELKSLRSLKREISELQRHIAEAGGAYFASERYKEMLRDRVEVLRFTYERILEEIEKVPDSRVRRVIMMHYVYGWTWQKIAFQIDATSESTPRLLLSRWLRRCAT